MAEQTALKTFEQGTLAEDLPSIEVPRGELDSGLPAFELFRRAGLASSNGEARRLIKGGGARVNDEKIFDEAQVIGSADINEQGVIKLSAGKKRHVLLRPQ